jgi:type IV pilus assembly protein PilZ
MNAPMVPASHAAPIVRPSRDTRTTPRTDLVLKVDYPDPSRFWSDYTENLSLGGTFIQTDVPYERGEQVRFSVSFPALLKPLDLRGEVMWRREGDERGTPPGVGVRFVFADDDERKRIEEALGRLLFGARGELPARQYAILLAEDNHLVREMFGYGMRKLARDTLGCPTRIDVVEAIDAESAWQALQAWDVDLAVVDLHLSEEQGAALVKRMRNDERLAMTPVLALSSCGEPSREAALQAGADLFLRKPISLIEVLSTIRRLLMLGTTAAPRDPFTAAFE